MAWKTDSRRQIASCYVGYILLYKCMNCEVTVNSGCEKDHLKGNKLHITECLQSIICNTSFTRLDLTGHPFSKELEKHIL
jgi:hypothetical protein